MLVGGPGGGYPQRKVVVAGPKKQEEVKRTEPDSTGARGYIIDRGGPPPTNTGKTGRK